MCIIKVFQSPVSDRKRSGHTVCLNNGDVLFKASSAQKLTLPARQKEGIAYATY